VRVAALYDIHGNLPALEAVLSEVRAHGVDQVIVGGDVFPGPLAVECLDVLLGLDIPVRFIRGNGDRVVAAEKKAIEPVELPEQYREVIRWNAAQLSPNHERTVESWPATLSLEIDGIGRVLFCHATPRNDVDVFTRLSEGDRLEEIFAAANSPLVVCGHTHMQFDRMIGTTRVVNAGSVGMPFAEPAAYWLLLDSDIHLQRTDYDLRAAADRIRQSNYPQAEQFATGNILAPPLEQQMVEAFTKVPLI
jgi:predicted phosphodiesterase